MLPPGAHRRGDKGIENALGVELDAKLPHVPGEEMVSVEVSGILLAGDVLLHP
jgi:hypothetical protein